jgi:AcrR family transcriptional regulator
VSGSRKLTPSDRAPPRQQDRLTQDERSAQTRARLMRATLTILDSRGYARASLADIAEAAGVTRGALNHHFSNKDDLVARAVALMLTEATDEIAALAKGVAAGSVTLDSFVDHLWRMFSGPLFMITLEHVTEARHNVLLKARLVPAVKEFHTSLNAIWQRFFQAHGVDASTATEALNATLCLLRGMGVQTVLRDEPEYYAGLVAHWKRHLHHLLDNHERAAPFRPSMT